MKFRTYLYELLPQNEIEELSKQVPEGEHAIWEYWSLYIEEMQYLKRKESTILSVRGYLQDFLRHSGILTLQASNTESIRNFLRFNSEKRNWSNGTHDTFRTKLSMFFGFLEHQEIIDISPMRKIRKMGKESSPQPTLLTSQFQQVIQCVHKNEKNEFIRIRNLLFFHLLGYAGLRRSEALSINISDIQFDKQSIWILPVKGTKGRMMTIENEVWELLESYISFRKKVIKDENIHSFFISYSGKTAWTISGVKRVLIKHSEILGFRIRCHMFRRMVATELAEKELPIEQIMRILGHNSIRTTESYIHSSSGKMCKNATSLMASIHSSVELELK